MLPSMFASEETFKQAFRQGLNEILQHNDLGCFILVCANAFADPELHQPLMAAIEQQFALLQQALNAGALETGEVTATAEDQAIFEKIVQQGLASIPLVQYREVAPWRCQFNHLRTFRPSRMAGKTQASIYQPFNEAGFNFNKPFLQKERLWEGSWQGQPFAWYFNKFPFAPYHGLIVPARLQQQAQYLTTSAHEFIWQFVGECGAAIPGLGLAYNSLGAFASVNHLHFQWFLDPAGLPVMSSQWQHHGGKQDYPLSCYYYTDQQAAWQAIDAWYQQGIPFNLIYVPGAVYVLPRRLQSQIQHEDWTSGFSWIETGGEMIVQTADAFARLTRDDIEQEMRKLNINKLDD